MASPLVLGGQTSLVVAFLLMRSPGFRTPLFPPGTVDGFPLLPISPVTALIVVAKLLFVEFSNSAAYATYITTCKADS